VGDLSEDGEGQGEQDGDEPGGGDDCECGGDGAARLERVDDDDVAVERDSRHGQCRHVDERGQSEVDGGARRPATEQPAAAARRHVPRHVERHVDERDEDVADGEVGDEDVGDAVQASMSPDDVADERVGEQRDAEDDQVGGAQQYQLRP